MDIRCQVSDSDIRNALERREKGFLLESPVTVALERMGYVGACHLASQPGPILCYAHRTSERLLRINPTKRLTTYLRAWFSKQAAYPTTFILPAVDVK